MKSHEHYQQALNKIRIFYKENDRLPSIGEVAKLSSYASRNSAVYLINQLIGANYLRKGTRGKLVTTPLFHQGVRLLGMVAAGFPTPEEEELLNTVSLDDFLIDKVTATFMLQVKGDSMINAGILPGDYVLVEKGKVPAIGSIVVAMVDGEWTMKYYHKENGKVLLRAANPHYPDIHPKEQLVIGGVVVSCCRKYT